MAVSNTFGFTGTFDERLKGSPKINANGTLPFKLSNFPTPAPQFTFVDERGNPSSTVRLLKSQTDNNGNGYFPGDNVVVADYDSPYIWISLENFPQTASGQFRFDYVAPHVKNNDLSVEIFDRNGVSLALQFLPKTDGTYQILSTSQKTIVPFTGTPSLIRVGGVLKEFGIDNFQFVTDDPTQPPPNQPPETITPPAIIIGDSTTAQIVGSNSTTAQVDSTTEQLVVRSSELRDTPLTGLGGTDSDGTVEQFSITSLPSATQGTLLLNSSNTSSTPVTLNQIIPANQIGNLSFQASSTFTSTSFTYAAIDNIGLQDATPATVTITSSSLIGTPSNDTLNGRTSNDTFRFQPLENGVGGYGGFDTISGFGIGDVISINTLDRNTRVTITTNSQGAAVIVIRGTANSNLDEQSAADTIVVSGVTREQLLAPGSQLLSVNGQFITTNDTVNSDGTSIFTVGNGLPGSDIRGRIINGTAAPDVFSPVEGLPTVASFRTTANDDIVNGSAGNDLIDGGRGNDSLDGGPGNDTLIGGSHGSDSLIGNADFDTLTGGAGNDVFRFTDFNPGVVDTITDFNVPEDRIQISASAFGGGLVAGQVGANAGTGTGGVNFEFSVNDGLPPADGAGYSSGIPSFYYDNSRGGLYFDRDGAGTADWVQFARLSESPGTFSPPPSFPPSSIEIIA